MTLHTSWHGFCLSVFLEEFFLLFFDVLTYKGDELSSLFNARGMIFTFAHPGGLVLLTPFNMLMVDPSLAWCVRLGLLVC